MTITYHPEIEQGSDEWFELRRGLLTASEMDLIITPTLKIANNDKSRSHLYELLAQRVSGYVEPTYISDAMQRGKMDEITARSYYEQKYAACETVGFVTNDRWGFTIGYSPDALVGDDGLIEVKSRRQKYQIETIIADEMPAEFSIQVQTGLLVTERKWCDFISFCGGLPMLVKRVYPDPVVQEAIVKAATAFEAAMIDKMTAYSDRLLGNAERLTETQRTIEQPMFT